ncbi:MAG: YncE family protein [Candidatus Solibacter usitatus]|nr:YncE family protein [Candidatus Solibacter usitatus]
MTTRMWMLIVMAAGWAAGGDRLLVVHKGDDSLGIYDASSGRLETKISVGKKPHEFALSSDGKLAYVTNYGVDTWNTSEPGGNSITVVDLSARKAVAEIDLGQYHRPHGIECGESGRFYVTTDFPAALLVVDGGKRKVAYAIPLNGKLPHMVLVSTDERKAWTADAGSGTVSVIDLRYRRQTHTLETGGVPMGLALTEDEKRLFVTTQSGNTVVLVDAVANTVRRRIGVPGGPARIIRAPDGKRMYVSLISSAEVAVLDPSAMLEVKRVAAGQRVEGMTIDAGGAFFYVSAQGENRILKYSLPELEPVLVIETAAKPDPLHVWKGR